MREITIKRKKSIIGAFEVPSIILDGVSVAKVKNGETTKITIDDDEHEIYPYYYNIKGNTLTIKPGITNIVLKLGISFSKFKLTPEIPNDDCKAAIPTPVQPKNQTASFICGALIAILLALISLLVYTIKETTLIGFIVGLILSIASGFVIIMGGFWFVVIPLPYIAIWKIGCTKPNQTDKRKIILGVLSFVFPLMVLIMLYLLRNINIF